jgi:chemotaxis protein CheX
MKEVPANELNAIFRGVEHVFHQHLNYEVRNGQATIQRNAIDSGDVSVIVGISGDISGKLVLGMSENVAKKIIGTMFGGAPVESIDDMGWSAFSEFGNWMGASCCNELLTIQIHANISPPLVNEGKSKIHFSESFISLPIHIDEAELRVHVVIAA